MKPLVAITPGEPAGIGPDICLQAILNNNFPVQPVLIADPLMLQERASLLGLEIDILQVDPSYIDITSCQNQIVVLPVPVNKHVQPGVLESANAGYVIETLRLAAELCQKDIFKAMITGPVQKSIINDAGIPFSGHTEFLAEFCNIQQVVMMLATEGLRVALVTTHLPLREVPAAITADKLRLCISILHHELEQKFGISNPHIIVAGLNPHAGEGGHLGTEESETITPVIKQMSDAGMHLTGPLPADTLFTPAILENCDAVLAMYHDQGLPVLKYKGFGQAVNITLGLPFIRTSVDHGTALALAGKNQADERSLVTAIQYASNMVRE